MNNLEILKIACCGANQFNDVDEIIKFLKKNSRAEIGVGISNQNTAFGRMRYNWIIYLFQKLKENNLSGQIALHVNNMWSKQIAIGGALPIALRELINYAPNGLRLQVNFVGSGFAAEARNPEKLLKLIKKRTDIRFILPYSPTSAEFIDLLSHQTNNFDVLYEQSYCTSTLTKSYQSNFKNIFQGYAGGFSPENIQKELGKISLVQKEKAKIWIDAEGKLRQDNCNALDLQKAQKFIDNINAWEKSVNRTSNSALVR